MGHPRRCAGPPVLCTGSGVISRVTGLWAIEAEWMGRYIDNILQPGEKVLYSTNAHWIFYWPAIVAGLMAIAFLVLSRSLVGDTPVMLARVPSNSNWSR